MGVLTASSVAARHAGGSPKFLSGFYPKDLDPKSCGIINPHMLFLREIWFDMDTRSVCQFWTAIHSDPFHYISCLPFARDPWVCGSVPLFWQEIYWLCLHSNHIFIRPRCIALLRNSCTQTMQDHIICVWYLLKFVDYIICSCYYSCRKYKSARVGNSWRIRNTASLGMFHVMSRLRVVHRYWLLNELLQSMKSSGKMCSGAGLVTLTNAISSLGDSSVEQNLA